VAVNLGGEAQKSGVPAAETAALIAAIAALPAVRCDGLMTMPPLYDDPDGVRPIFRALRALRDQLATEAVPLRVLSMGTTGDFEAAVAEGATLVRIGTAIFGARPSLSDAAATGDDPG
jgi:PLP dependent protein